MNLKMNLKSPAARAAAVAVALLGLGVLVVMGTGREADRKKDAKGAGPKGPPPAIVTVEEVVRGRVEPTAEYVGTVYYAHVSDVASEVAGKVREVDYEEGRRVKTGQVLVRLSTDLLEKTIEGTRSSYEQAALELEKAQKGLRRMEPLFKEGSIAESAYEEHIYSVKGIEKKVSALRADLSRLELQKKKNAIRAPFGGIVLKKSVERGEWVPAGGTVAVLADDREVDVVVDVPEEILGYLRPGREVAVKTGGRRLTGRFVNFVPRGDVATRTFSVKVRLKNTTGLMEGMEARAIVPSGAVLNGLVVPRDAVIKKSGQDVVFTVNGSTARMAPVRVTGYDGLRAGVEAEGLEEGMEVIVKGNERIRDGQPLTVIGRGTRKDAVEQQD